MQATRVFGQEHWHQGRAMNPLIVIPSRLGATRLPGKPLAAIAGEPMIVHVWRRAVASAAGPVLVACADAEIAAAVRLVSGTVVMTDPALPTGSDRVSEAVELVDPDGDFDVVVNLQGDMPTLDPALVRTVLKPLEDARVDIATLAVEIADAREIEDPNVVKIALELDGKRGIGRALYFSRAAIPSGSGARYHHLGIYAYRRAALQRFVRLAQSALERSEKLEQLRALAHGMRIDAAIVETIPLGVDTPADLERARALIGARH
jgi:3-deoxy-manno-octulosonate cytidylyltransferase (CMP-KDO synthetase)